LQDGVPGHHQADDDHHQQGQHVRGVGGVGRDLVGQRTTDLGGQQRVRLADQGGGGGVGGERVGEQQQQRRDESRRQDRAGHPPPVHPGGAAERLRRLAPLLPDPVQRGQENDDH